MTSKEDEARRDWLFLEQIVGDSGLELWGVDDGDPVIADHEPSEAEADELAAAVDDVAGELHQGRGLAGAEFAGDGGRAGDLPVGGSLEVVQDDAGRAAGDVGGQGWAVGDVQAEGGALGVA